jgi:hypothetical protein
MGEAQEEVGGMGEEEEEEQLGWVVDRTQSLINCHSWLGQR